MAKQFGKQKRIACLTPEQQAYYDGLNNNQRRYVDYRSMGYNKTQSYQMAGYSGKKAGQAAYILESTNKGMTEIIEARLKAKRVNSIVSGEDEKINQQIDALAMQKTAEKVLSTIENADAETAQRIQFYRDVINGKIKSVKKTKKLNADGAVISTTIEEISDINSRLTARKELDRVLGLNQVIDVGKLDCGDITINIVDASKKDEIEDKDKNVIDMKKVEEVDGDKVVVVEEEEIEDTSKKAKFFEMAGDG